MRRIFVLVSVLLCSLPLLAQAQYGNEWINYSKTYWKFKVGTEGIFRISKATLDAAGVPAANGSDYVLYRDGKEVTLFVSNSGSFAGGDYLEFYATANDGQLDKELYLAADKYANDNMSLFNDTAIYFLTTDNSTPHKRYTAVTTPIPGTPPAAAPYCWNTVLANGKSEFSPGKTNGPVQLDYAGIIELYSSQFDWGEGYLINWNNSLFPANVTINAPNLVLASVNARLQTACVGRARDSIHKLKLSVNGNLKADVVYGVNDIRQFDLSIPATDLSTSNTLTFAHSQTGIADVFGYPYWKLEYPRDWNFSGQDYFRFRINASASNQYLEITNFSHGGTAPRLYDITNGKYYTGDISITGKTRFYIDPLSANSEMVLVATASGRIMSAPFAAARTFTNYANASGQGNYLLITHRNLMKPNAGKDYIQEYRNYRASAAGGGHTVVVADVEELYDQFAYGIYTHPLSISHFIQYALDKWSIKPRNVFLIGKGVTYEHYKAFAASSLASTFEGIVPTYGSPGSDVAFVTDRTTWKMKVNIGRLSAWNTTDIANYLNKVQAYEAALLPAAFPTPASELWKKQVLHIAGGDGSTPFLQATTLLPTLRYAEAIIAGPKTGAVVSTIIKNTKGLPTTVEDKAVDSLISNGLSMITYYGHGSAVSLDYNIKDPSAFDVLPRVPVFTAFGCDISTIYEANTAKTITERYIAAPRSGATVAMASNNQGWTNIHSRYMPIMYARMANQNYGQTIGDQNRAAHDSFMQTVSVVPNQTSFEYTHVESFILQGDPAIPLSFAAQKPDYYVGAEGLSTIPANITTALDSFQLRINSFNLGRVFSDTVVVKVEHIAPDGKTRLVKSYTVTGLANKHVATLWIPIDKTRDLGLNKYKVTIDADLRYDEVSEANNVAVLDVFVLSDNVVPIFPYNFSIVYNPDLTLKASTLNPFKGLARYRIEIDTTELFNSPSRLQTTIESKGGVIRWKPSLSLQDSVVYYWRTSLDSAIGGAYKWTNSSFIYLKNGSSGWNQSHYYQYKYNQLDSLQYPSSRLFQYGQSEVTIRNLNTVMWLPFPYNSYTGSDYNRVYRSGALIQRYDCFYGGSLQVFVFDSSTGMPMQNAPGGKFGSVAPCFGTNFQSFSFDITNATSRDNARKFLESIPNGNYVFVRNNISYNIWGHYYINKWKDDTLIYGSGVSLYHTLRNMGFNKIDSFNKLCLFSMLCKKGSPDFAVKQDFSKDTNEIMDVTYTFPVTDVRGKMNSVVVGPASSWKSLKWRTSSFFDTAATADSASVKVTGIDASDKEILLYEGTSRDESLAFIDAATYPRLKLQWYSVDTIYHTAPQLDYWRVLYDPLPEAALNPSAHYVFTDSVNVGQKMTMETAIETLTELPMDSMLVRYRIIDANGVSHTLGDVKYRKLDGNDSLHAGISFDPKPYPGKNYLFIEANPDGNQPEQYHPNNLGYIPFTVETDEYNPVMDVTFDGVHIRDRDIVSSKPLIKVMLRDENKYLALNDTSSMKLFMRFPEDPEDTRRRIPYDGTICRFIGADMSGGKNEAYIEYRPELKDGIYQLYAKGEDASGNGAGAGREYSISFEVISKSTITNVLNCPNPFSTSTAFMFTLTGPKIPTLFKIQIISMTGSVVREITQQELGPIHVGRNITEYRWDGRDQNGQVLPSGVYLYRVVTEIDGNPIEHRGSEIDKFFKNGCSKMCIIR